MSTNHKKLPATELLNTQLSVEQININKDNYSEELIHREKLQNTPFEIVGNEEHKYFIALGKYRLTEPFNKKEHLTLQQTGLLYLIEDQWNIQLNLLTLFQEFHTLDLINQGYIQETSNKTPNK